MSRGKVGREGAGEVWSGGRGERDRGMEREGRKGERNVRQSYEMRATHRHHLKIAPQESQAANTQ